MSFAGQLCILCELRPSTTGDAEHAWPRWLVERFRGGGPFTLYENETPVTKRDGVTPRQSSGFPGVKVPACDACNAILARRFEQPGRNLIRSIFDSGGAIRLSAAEANLLAEWLVKTWLLLAHPAARHGEPRMIQKPWNLKLVVDDLYSWMVDGSPPPDVLSLWLMRRDMNVRKVAPEKVQVPLPSVSTDGRVIKFQSLWLGLDVLEAQLVYHPHWPIEHPLELEGRAVKLWPRDATVPPDLGTLPAIDSREMSWLSGIRVTLQDNTFGAVSPPPLSPTCMLYSLPGPIVGVAGESEL